MRNRPSYIFLALLAMVTASCSDELLGVEEELEGGNIVTFAANSARMVTKAGLQYTNFEVGNKYLLYGVSHADTYDWNNAVMYDTPGTEDKDHLIDYGEDVFFDGRSLDFYGATICSTENSETAYPVNVNTVKKPASPVIGLNVGEKGLPDLMYSRNLKTCTSQQGLLEMNFTHALSKVQVEVSKQDDGAGLAGATIKGLSIVNTSSSGELDIVTGTWAIDDTDASRTFYNGETTVTTEPSMVLNADGTENGILIFPNETSGQVVSLKIDLATDKGGNKTVTYPLYTSPSEDSDDSETLSPFIFNQNKRYVLSIILLNDGVRVLVVSPQAFDWIDVDVNAYLGQPVNFGGLMWMDRNLGATNWDCENDWANTRGFYYQYGRNIPYIFDDEKFRNRYSEKATFRKHKDGQLDLGYEYFFTYNEKGERVYGAVQGGTKTGHKRFMVDTLNINGECVGWVNNGGGWEWQGSYMAFVDAEGEKLEKSVGQYSNSDGGYGVGDFWMPEQKGKDGVDWTANDNRIPVWRGPQATSSNIAVNPGDPGIYHFIFDSRFYHDRYQSGAWCVKDCDASSCENDLNWKGPAPEDTKSYYEWLRSGCWETRQEDTERVNRLWVDRSNKPTPENHPCPKGWRIPTKEDFAGIMPDHNIENKWANTSNTMYVLKETYGDVNTGQKEAAIYGVDEQGRKVIYVIKRKGESECYRLRLLWKDSNLTRNAYYNLSESKDPPMQYLEISRYPGDSDMSFDEYYNGKVNGVSVGSQITTNSGQTASITGAAIHKDAWKISGDQLSSMGFYGDFDWDRATETLLIPICGFIYTALGVDGMFGDGEMTILRCCEWSHNYDLMAEIATYATESEVPYAAGEYPYNEALNWCCYIRTDRNTGMFSGSRKSLGDQIRCVRDVNAQ